MSQMVEMHESCKSNECVPNETKTHEVHQLMMHESCILNG